MDVPLFLVLILINPYLSPQLWPVKLPVKLGPVKLGLHSNPFHGVQFQSRDARGFVMENVEWKVSDTTVSVY